MGKDEMKAVILDLVRTRRGSVSFAELAKNIAEFSNTDIKFGYQMLYPEGDNIVIWHGMSHTAVHALDELRREFRIVFRPTQKIVYLVDGLLPEMPLATRVHAYQKPHWLPMVIDLGAEEPYQPPVEKPQSDHPSGKILGPLQQRMAELKRQST